ncbi:hypothetical protein [Dyadobacter sp. CY356]|uniref:hypothetical protein n=1 Tax=Dyadobacter sp. CY356 TaxID=2906442 RepID=UPI001F33B750|nr:hypothetical protein [Dyadobacter sp. CY356]MCF0054775.1 hypothetical protein [Dyadobacter sp. CY356]
MKEIYYMIVGPQMVWIWYYDAERGKNLREILGYEAIRFTENIPDNAKRVDSSYVLLS